MTKDFLLSLSLGHCNSKPSMTLISKGLLMEMNIFRTREGFLSETLLTWLQALCAQLESINSVELNDCSGKLRQKSKQCRGALHPNVSSPDLTDVTFMTRRGNNNTFRWPESEDIDRVAAKYVLDSNFEITPKNRSWSVFESMS